MSNSDLVGRKFEDYTSYINILPTLVNLFEDNEDKAAIQAAYDKIFKTEIKNLPGGKTAFFNDPVRHFKSKNKNEKK